MQLGQIEMGDLSELFLFSFLSLFSFRFGVALILL